VSAAPEYWIWIWHAFRVHAGHDVAGERPIDLVRVRYVDGDGRERVVRVEQAAGVSFEDGRMARSIPSYRGHRPPGVGHKRGSMCGG
jgi:hypothetical protein